MATLTLKKSPQILSGPITPIHGTFAIMRQHENVKSMRFTCYHESQNYAKKEAIRLQAEHPTSRYLILQIVDHVGGD